MSNILKKVSGQSPTDVLRNNGHEFSIYTNIFSIAISMGIDLRLKDFSDLESECDIQKGTILGCIVDSEENQTLTIYVQDKLPESDFYEGMSEKQKNNILRRRQRFTVAHEIAHACMHLESQDVKLKIDYNSEFGILKNDLDKDEYEANIFAGELLIPKKALLDVCNRLIKPSLDVLVDIFDVSHSVMRERLVFLGLTKIIKDGAV